MVPVAATFDDGPYTLDTGDKLRIVVFGQDALSNNYIVDAAGPGRAAADRRGHGARADHGAAGRRHRGRLEQGYIRDPSVAVEIETYRPFFVLGEVTYPGPISLRAQHDGRERHRHRRRLHAARLQGHGHRHPQVKGVPARLTLPLRYPLRPGDTITVPERWF